MKHILLYLTILTFSISTFAEPPDLPPGKPSMPVSIENPLPLPVTLDSPLPLPVTVENPTENVEVSGEVEVSNLPIIQDVNVVNDTREQVEITQTVLLSDGQVTGLIFGPNRPLIPLLEVPTGMKLVITDLLATHNIVGEEEVLGANIRRAGADTNCSEGPFALRVQLRVGPGSGTNVSLSTGIEYLPGERVCLATGGTAENPNLGISYALFGYLTPL